MPDTSGLLIIDKPQGVTSFDVVAAVRGALHLKKVGHAGTLDPMATGVLIVGFGAVTRLLNPIVGHDKTYEATIRLGQRTTTDDADGEIIEPQPSETRPAALPDLATIKRTIAERLTGEIMQVPNAYSAIKIHGQRAYDLAREGKDVELEARPVTIRAFDVLAAREGLTAADGTPVTDLDVRVDCSSGTYIRALARDLGDMLGVGGHLTRLRRTRVGRFDLSDPAIAAHVVHAHTEERAFTNREGETVTRNRAVLDLPGELPGGLPGPSGNQPASTGAARALALIDRALPAADAARLCMPSLEITDDEARELRFGRRIERAIAQPAAAIAGDDLVAIVDRANAHQAKPVTVFAA
ncbi:tRNA pseudouridine(55) synthase TruB [Bifidobacterium avesanii]|uniref:tRNA pseudouridine(55) synthase TruB n=1 Tax=Bifidobacterium avesanii TaxID=1798157 RepID=UPI0013818A4B|nr:tRNA pseudouridine(55) synthase TruB [Bifidobacterium avesanii]KAB8294568.1 pseudouridine synthase [Bifidobacterium avesanii]